MFDFDLGKLLLIGVVALIFIPPKDLPAALRQLGKLVGQARRIATDFQSQFNEALREAELSDLKDEFSHLKKAASLEGALNQIAEIVEPVQNIEPAGPARALMTQAPLPEMPAPNPLPNPLDPSQP